jgi:RNA polymerase sigma-70 factor (ECF subfamily)
VNNRIKLDGGVDMIRDVIPEDFNEIFTDYYRPLYNYVGKLVKDSSLVDDLTQETFIKVMVALRNFDEDKNLLPWIFRIAHNTCMDYYRRNRVNYELVEDIECCDLNVSSPEHILLNKEKRHEIKEALLKIGYKYRRVLMLRAYRDLSYREIAAQLRLNESTVKTLMRRGRQQFQKVYTEVY